jgi:hypothetical protein
MEFGKVSQKRQLNPSGDGWVDERAQAATELYLLVDGKRTAQLSCLMLAVPSLRWNHHILGRRTFTYEAAISETASS